MARMTSDLSEVKPRIPAPKDKYLGRIKEKEDTRSKEREKDGRKVGGNPMCVLTWEIMAGSEMGKEIRFDNVILGGTNEKGAPIVPFQLCQLLDASGIPWECAGCRNGEEPRKFYFGQGPDKDGYEQGKPYCPDCKSPNLRIEYDTDNFIGAQCNILVDIQKAQNSDDEFNVIKRYLPIE